ncbi:MAG: sugar ABC transporter permease [Planctomycetota bacterium]
MLVISWKKLRYYWPAYLLILLPLALVITFNYFPIFNGFIHIFYRWNGDNIEEYIGLGNIRRMWGDDELWMTFRVVIIFIFANIVKMIPAIFAAVVIHHILSDRMQYAYRVMFVIPMIVPGVVMILLWKYFYEPNAGILNNLLRSANVLGPTETIQWLSDSTLVIPAIIFQGFPWVGAFSVLLYLAGLQNISKEIYESAYLDGARPFQVFWHVELPLIMTQVRISLVLMMIATVRGWEYIYLLLGEGGGPNGIATVPGLLIFREAFSQGYFGYGCAVGFLLFLITLVLTWFNSRFVRVEK